jgi:hypothetical protein
MCDTRGAAHDRPDERKSFLGKRFLAQTGPAIITSCLPRAGVDGSAACALYRPLQRRISRSDLVASVQLLERLRCADGQCCSSTESQLLVESYGICNNNEHLLWRESAQKNMTQ